MWFGPIWRWFMLFVLGAYLCVGLGQPVPSAYAANTGMSVTMDMADGGTMPMPCKAKIPDCYSSIGCIFMVALPLAYIPTATPTAWSRIVYASVTVARAGTSLEPDLGPPIHA